MKKQFVFCGVFMVWLLAACGKPSVKSQADKFCRKMDEFYAAEEKGDDEKMKRLDKELENMEDELQRLYPRGSKEEKELDEYIDACKLKLYLKYPRN